MSKRFIILVAILISVLLASSFTLRGVDQPSKQVVVPAEDWTMFQKDARHNGYSEQDVKFGDVLWTVEETAYPGGPAMFGTPVVGQEKVFVEIHQDIGLAVLPPHMYYGLYALDANSGETIWTYEKYMPGFETRHSPLLLEDKVVIGNLYEVIALDSNNGSVLWTFASSQAYPCYFGSPVSISDIIAVGCNYGWWDSSLSSRLFVLSSDTGEEIWNATFEAHSVVPTLDESSVYISDFAGHVFSFDFDGNELWSIYLSEHIDSPLTLDGDFIYLGSENGTVYVINKSNGDIVWKLSGFDEIHSSFAVSPHSFYFVTLAGSLHAFDKNDRTEDWNTSLDGFTLSSPVLGRNALILPSGRYIYFIEPSTGDVLWRYQFTTYTFTPPYCVSSTASISKDIVLFPTNVGKLFAFTSKNPDEGSDITIPLLTVGVVAMVTVGLYAVYKRPYG